MGSSVKAGSGLGQWAAQALQSGQGEAGQGEAPIPPGADAVTIADLLSRPDLPQPVREWLEQVQAQGLEWGEANNPPNWVADEACWEKAKRAAEHATGDPRNYAFATWFYVDHVGCAMR